MLYIRIYTGTHLFFELIPSNTVQRSLTNRKSRTTHGRNIHTSMQQNLSTHHFAAWAFCGSAKILWISSLSPSHGLCLALLASSSIPYTGHCLSNTLCSAAWTTVQSPRSQSQGKPRSCAKRAPGFKVACGKYSLLHSVIEVRDVSPSEFSNVTSSPRE